jgi:hypothetical protein
MRQHNHGRARVAVSGGSGDGRADTAHGRALGPVLTGDPGRGRFNPGSGRGPGSSSSAIPAAARSYAGTASFSFFAVSISFCAMCVGTSS